MFTLSFYLDPLHHWCSVTCLENLWFIELLHPGNAMSHDASEELNVGPDFGVEIAALKPHGLAHEDQIDALRWVELGPFKPVIGQRRDVAIFGSQLEHNGSLVSAP